MRSRVNQVAGAVLGLILLLRAEGVALEGRWVSVSAYTDASGAPPWGITASGRPTRPGVAACGRDVPFGTLVILADGRRVACWDRGGEIGPWNVDVWMADEGQAIRAGRRRVWGWMVRPIH